MKVDDEAMKENSLVCLVCDKTFKHKVGLDDHMNRHLGIKPHKCPHCDDRFSTRAVRFRHIRYLHTREHVYRCELCEYTCVEAQHLERHKNYHTGNRPHQCPHCSYASHAPECLKRHLLTHSGEKPFQCDVCQRRFSQSIHLKSHKKTHQQPEERHHCKLCSRSFLRETYLKSHHQRMHSRSVEPLECSTCRQVFSDRHALNEHRKGHKMMKLFRCSLCPYSSNVRRSLERHMVVHTGHTQHYPCPQCNKSFADKFYVKVHQKRSHTSVVDLPKLEKKTHSCPECGKEFLRKGNLTQHREKFCSATDKVLGQASEIIDDPNAFLIDDEEGDKYFVLEIYSEKDPKEPEGMLTQISKPKDNDAVLSGSDDDQEKNVRKLLPMQEPNRKLLQRQLDSVRKDVEDSFGFSDDIDGEYLST